MIPNVLRSCNILQAHLLLSWKSMASSLVCWATIWDCTKDTQSFSASSGAILYPSVRRAVGENPGNEVAISPRVASTTCFAVPMWNRWVLSDAISPTRCLEWGTSQLFEGNVKKQKQKQKTKTKTTTTNAIRTGLWSLTFTKKILYSRGNRV